MAEFVESLDEEVGNDEFQAVEAKTETAPTQEEPTIPEKYKGKSLDDIIRMHQEAEKLIGRQAQEVGEVRKLADELIKRQITPQDQPAKAIEDDTDFFADPVKAVNKAVESHPAVVQAQQAAALRHRRIQRRAHVAGARMVRQGGGRRRPRQHEQSRGHVEL